MRTLALLLATLALGAGTSAAQQRVDETIPASRTGSVEISNVSGSVVVTGWDRDEIRVTGTLGAGTERLALERGRDRTEIRVVVPRNARNVRGSDLEVRVPSRSNLTVRTVSADVTVNGVHGVVSAGTTSGDVEVAGRPAQVAVRSTSGDVEINTAGSARVQAHTTSGDIRVAGSVRDQVDVESVSGDIEMLASTPEVRAKVVSGDVRLRGVTGRISANSVSGNTEILDSRIQYGSFETVSGNVRYAGALERGAALRAQSHSGTIELLLPRNVSAEFEARTFSGDIQSDFGGEVRRRDRYGPGRELRLAVGNGGALVTLETFSGTVKLLRR